MSGNVPPTDGQHPVELGAVSEVLDSSEQSGFPTADEREVSNREAAAVGSLKSFGQCSSSFSSVLEVQPKDEANCDTGVDLAEELTPTSAASALGPVGPSQQSGNLSMSCTPHRLVHNHPWAQYVTLRDDPMPTDPECVTSALPTDLYPHLKGGGYLSSRFVRSLFPRTFREKPSKRNPIPVIELMRLEHAVHFREASQRIINELRDNTYWAEDSTLPQTLPNTMPSVLLPKSKPHFPVLYQVEFVFVTPTAIMDRVYGIVLSRHCRHGGVTGLRIAFESAPEMVAVSPSVCNFSLEEAEENEFVTALSRQNVSTAMRFSEKPASNADLDRLCLLIRHFLPAHPQESLLPLKIFKLEPSEKELLNDRIGPFRSYRQDPAAAQSLMAKLFNVACSALVALNCSNDDRRTHSLTATVPSLDAYPVCFDFTVTDMSSESGWTLRRPVYLWIVGARSLIPATIQRSSYIFPARSIVVRLVASAWCHDSAMAAIEDFGTAADGVTSVPICVKLGAPPTGADPVYDIISSLRLFSGISLTRGSRAGDVLDTVYGDLRSPTPPVATLSEKVQFSFAGETLKLRPDQVQVLQVGSRNLPILAIQGGFATGKTVIGALLAARIHINQKSTVVAITTTNPGVAQFTETFLHLDEYRELNVLRYVGDSALMEGTPQTAVDIHTVLKRLADDYGHLMDSKALGLCRRYKRGRGVVEKYMFDPSSALHLTEEEKDEYRIAEREVSGITTEMIRTMFTVRPPAILCLTTSALLNAATSGGIFAEFLSNVEVVIGDEASQIPEPAMLCREIVLTMLAKDVAPSSIGIITFYKEQFRLLQDFATSVAVDIHTVDSVQGREKDVVVLLTTRTGIDASQGDFLDDPKRLNVALSRCRHGQFVLGDQHSLEKLPNWQAVLEWARYHGCVTESSTVRLAFGEAKYAARETTAAAATTTTTTLQGIFQMGFIHLPLVLAFEWNPPFAALQYRTVALKHHTASFFSIISMYGRS
ncbi:hypothetical protein Q1695_013429 [Nippostrongylus brasiliensis]|nr:hypothetical protein Q1695_013429 [Nippostrongylus brasiliensis]